MKDRQNKRHISCVLASILMAVSGFYKMHCPLKGKATIILTALHFISTVWMGCILLKCGGKCALGLPGTSILNTESCDCYMANKIA